MITVKVEKNGFVGFYRCDNRPMADLLISVFQKDGWTAEVL